MKAVIISILISSCGLPVWSKQNVEIKGKIESESEVAVKVESDAKEVCQPLLDGTRYGREAYAKCVADYIDAMSCLARGPNADGEVCEGEKTK